MECKEFRTTNLVLMYFHYPIWKLPRLVLVKTMTQLYMWLVQWSRTLDIESGKCRQLILDKCTQVIPWRKDSLSNELC